jgi:hypothetical protein
MVVPGILARGGTHVRTNQRLSKRLQCPKFPRRRNALGYLFLMNDRLDLNGREERLTRARDHLHFTGVDPVCEFLDDILKTDHGRSL